jgi:peptidoglycan/xylan/chitin deacetylase (PgdA/CDA1 family)
LSRRSVPILLYHSVSDDPPKDTEAFAIPPRSFRRQLDTILRNQMTPLTVSAFVEAMIADALPPRAVVITFDDGWADFASIAAPAMSERGVVSTLYVTTGLLQHPPTWVSQLSRRPTVGSSSAMCWDQIAELAGRGVEIGAHSCTHRELDTLPASASREEIVTSKEDLERAIRVPVRSFAYPHGYHGAAVRRQVIEAGFASACAVRNVLSSNDDDRFALSRLTVRESTSDEVFEAWLEGTRATTAAGSEALMTKAWRMARRARKTVRSWPRPSSADLRQREVPES